ncbi:glycosyltransferase family 25 protein [Pseudogemmobacter humi]|uniref:Glycosyltransferase family 25 (LPS biosynthesis protein) n=1 Tax=Pseudogemmobacter humi TaxID=2483812 RepID=A0A3P5XWR9_9RHOB|nr:glycosyltransferase family 25 protein [Pseudogemmobacter humi]VDC33615.1 Glycosyltransferase family 25 (LPS biosynthesis protein) [Pseudogemmobacter humi]
MADQADRRAREAGAWPIFVVSLADAYARRENIRAQLQEFGLTAEITDAVDGRQGLSAESEALIDREGAAARVGRRVSGAEFACALSHQKLYQTIIDRGLAGAIILEDDAILTKGFAEFVAGSGFLSADLVQLDHLDARIWPKERKIFAPGLTFFRLAENAGLTTGYSISAKAAGYILEHSRPLAGLADWPCDVMPLSPLVTLPRIVDHPDIVVSDSALERERDASRKSAASSASPRALRFFRTKYWRRWWLKRRTKKIS